VTTRGPNRLVGAVFTVAGIIGVLTGAVPFVVNALRIVRGPEWWQTSDWAGHGVEAMGLGVEWGMLSSAMGLCLGVILLWAARCWFRGLDHAPVVTWAYVLFGLGVNVTDMFIFALNAKPGRMRTHMLWADGAALAFAVMVGLWLLVRRERKDQA